MSARAGLGVRQGGRWRHIESTLHKISVIGRNTFEECRQHDGPRGTRMDLSLDGSRIKESLKDFLNCEPCHDAHFELAAPLFLADHFCSQPMVEYKRRIKPRLDKRMAQSWLIPLLIEETVWGGRSC